MTQLELALKVATECHKGQTRSDGVTPYIEHPIAVSELCNHHDTKTIALLHDTIEDGMTIQDLEDRGVSDFFIKRVKVLTHKENETYFKYISRIKESESKSAIEVKKCDIVANLCDNPSESQKKRYFKAYRILNN